MCPAEAPASPPTDIPAIKPYIKCGSVAPVWHTANPQQAIRRIALDAFDSLRAFRPLGCDMKIQP